MPEGMTPEQCRAAQRECARAIFSEIATLRKETKEDIAIIRDAVQTIDRAVASIKGFLGLNGNAQDQRDTAHIHKRNSEEIEHLHRRVTDLIEKLENPPAPEVKELEEEKRGIYVPKWLVLTVGGILLIAVAIAGEKIIKYTGQ